MVCYTTLANIRYGKGSMFYVTLAIPDEDQANRLVEDMREYPDGDLLTPTQEHQVHACIVATWESE